MVDRKALEERYHQVRASIPPHVQLIAVSKKRTVEEIQVLYDLGHRDFGENYPQELRDKHPLLPQDIRWHFIGNLQSNKAKYVAPIASLVHTVDSESLLDELNKRAVAAERELSVLIQVHIAQEVSKHGLPAEKARQLLANWQIDRWPAILPVGLMGMATNTPDQDQVRGEFRDLKELLVRLRSASSWLGDNLRTLSMGMSSDAAIAIDEGSTMVRIGTAIFGER